jgi:REP element-mobilizing transposase RayT
MIKGRPPRLPQIFNSYGAPLFFVTICTFHRRKIPSLEAAHNALLLYATRATEEFNVALGRYVIMPDHLHLFVRGDQTFGLATWVKGLKRAILKVFPSEFRTSFWQPGLFDHLLRSDESYAQKWEYVRQNPVRAGLVKFAEDWP